MSELIIAADSLTGTMLDALRRLAEARNLAHTLGRDPWDFAVRGAILIDYGLTLRELCELAADELIDHAMERRPAADGSRQFRRLSHPTPSLLSCYVILPTGLKLIQPDGDVPALVVVDDAIIVDAEQELPRAPPYAMNVTVPVAPSSPVRFRGCRQ